MNAIKTTVARVAKNFSNFINRVVCQSKSFILHKGKREGADIIPIIRGKVLGELPEILSQLPRLSKEELDSFSKDLEDIRKQSHKAERYLNKSY
jgi:hypothetical protein